MRFSVCRLAAGHHFEAAYIALDGIPPDPKLAMRNVFYAVEGLFRLIFPNAHQLNGAEITKHLKPRIDGTYQNRKPEIYAAQQQVAQLTDWVDGAHFYGHEPGTEEPAQPPLEMAIQYAAPGSFWLRWLCEFDTISH